MNVRLFHSFIHGTDYGKATSFPQGEGNTRAFATSRLVIFTRARIRFTAWKMMKGLLLVYRVPIYGMDLAIFDFFPENMMALSPGVGLGRVTLKWDFCMNLLDYAGAINCACYL